MKLDFLLLHTQLYQKAFRQYLPQTTAYVTIPKFLKKKQIGAWKPVVSMDYYLVRISISFTLIHISTKVFGISNRIY